MLAKSTEALKGNTENHLLRLIDHHQSKIVNDPITEAKTSFSKPRFLRQPVGKLFHMENDLFNSQIDPDWFMILQSIYVTCCHLFKSKVDKIRTELDAL